MSDNEKRDHCVYMHIFTNSECYIGQTSQDPPNKRIKAGFKSEYNSDVIEAYDNGKGLIKSVIIHDFLTKKEADKLEDYEIINHNTLNTKSGGLNPYGLNRARGGGFYPTLKCENHPQAKLTNNQVNAIKNSLIDINRASKMANNDKSKLIKIHAIYSKLADNNGVSGDIIRSINRGDTWKDELMAYPIYEDIFINSLLGKICSDHTKNKISESLKGEKHHNCKITQKKADNIKNSLIQLNNASKLANGDKFKLAEIHVIFSNLPKYYDVTTNTISKINNGVRWNDTYRVYPLYPQARSNSMISKSILKK